MKLYSKHPFSEGFFFYAVVFGVVVLFFGFFFTHGVKTKVSVKTLLIKGQLKHLGSGMTNG